MAPGVLQVQHLQFLRTPAAPSHGQYPHEAHGGSRCGASRTSHTNPCPIALAGSSESWPWPGCYTRRNWTRPCWRARHLVSLHGRQCQEKWHHRLPGTEPPCCLGNPPCTKPLPPSALYTDWQEKDRVWLLEWLPQHCPAWVWPAPDHLQHPMGMLQIQNSYPGLRSIRGWLLKAIQQTCLSHTKQDQVHWRYQAMGRQPNRKLFSGSQLAWTLDNVVSH